MTPSSHRGKEKGKLGREMGCGVGRSTTEEKKALSAEKRGQNIKMYSIPTYIA